MRALVSIFAALLILISLYQLSFTWFVNKHEKEMKQKAMQQTKRLYPTANFQVKNDVKNNADLGIGANISGQNNTNSTRTVRRHVCSD